VTGIVLGYHPQRAPSDSDQITNETLDSAVVYKSQADSVTAKKLSTILTETYAGHDKLRQPSVS